MLALEHRVFLLSALVGAILCGNLQNTRQEIKLSSDGGYTNLLVAIDDRVTENYDVLNNIQVTYKMWYYHFY